MVANETSAFLAKYQNKSSYRDKLLKIIDKISMRTKTKQLNFALSPAAPLKPV